MEPLITSRERFFSLGTLLFVLFFFFTQLFLPWFPLVLVFGMHPSCNFCCCYSILRFFFFFFLLLFSPFSFFSPKFFYDTEPTDDLYSSRRIASVRVKVYKN